MSLTLTDRDLRELLIRHAAAVVKFKRACLIHAKAPEKMAFSDLTTLRTLIDDAEEEIQAFKQNYLG